MCKTDGRFVSAEVIENTEQFLQNVVITMTQCKILLETCPQEANFGDEVVEIPVLTPKSSEFSIHRNDDKWNHISSCLNETLNASQKLRVVLEKTNKSIPNVERDLIVPKFLLLVQEDDVTNNIALVSSKIDAIRAYFAKTPLSDTLTWLRNEAASLQISYRRDPGNVSSAVQGPDFNSRLRKMTRKVSVVVENIHKRYSEEKQVDAETEDKDAYALNEAHFRDMIVQSLGDDLDNLQLQDLVKLVRKTAAALFDEDPTGNGKLRDALSQALPLLEQLALLYQYYITQQVSAYRITCKMASILLNIFINLVSEVSVRTRVDFYILHVQS